MKRRYEITNNGRGIKFPDRMPPVLYKFMELKYAEDALNKGIFRIGTLSDFRKMENHADTIGGPNEGIFRHRMFLGDFDNKRGDYDVLSRLDQHALQGFFPAAATKDRMVKLSGFSFEGNHRIEDMFVYCTSYEFSIEAMQKVGYDACLRIGSRLVERVIAE